MCVFGRSTPTVRLGKTKENTWSVLGRYKLVDKVTQIRTTMLCFVCDPVQLELFRLVPPILVECIDVATQSSDCGLHKTPQAHASIRA